MSSPSQGCKSLSQLCQVWLSAVRASRVHHITETSLFPLDVRGFCDLRFKQTKNVCELVLDSFLKEQWFSAYRKDDVHANVIGTRK